MDKPTISTKVCFGNVLAVLSLQEDRRLGNRSGHTAARAVLTMRMARICGLNRHRADALMLKSLVEDRLGSRPLPAMPEGPNFPSIPKHFYEIAEEAAKQADLRSRAPELCETWDRFDPVLAASLYDLCRDEVLWWRLHREPTTLLEEHFGPYSSREMETESINKWLSELDALRSTLQAA